jgi:hypothetical protein
MNITEITAQVQRDYEKITDTTLIRLRDEYDRERKKLKIDKRRTYSKIYTFKTAAKNNWIVVLAKAPSSECYQSGTVCLVHKAVTYYYDERGLKVVTWTKPVLEMWTGHFFKRYNERLKLGLNTPVDSIKHYLIHNQHTGYECTCKNKIAYLTGYAKDGLLLGNLQSFEWLLWRTFVSRDLLRSNQNEMQQQLIKKMETDLIKSAAKNTKSDEPSLHYNWSRLKVLKGNFNPL